MKQLSIVLCLLFAGHATAQVAMMDLNDVPGDMPVCVTNWGPYVVANSAGLASHINRTDNPHVTTAEQIGALTAEADPLAGPRLQLIESETNRWAAAWSWGDHALAGYLPSSSWLTWLDTNTYVRAETWSSADMSAWTGGDGQTWAAGISAGVAGSLIYDHANVPDLHLLAGDRSRIDSAVSAADAADIAAAAVTNAPVWIVYTNIASSVTVTNDSERPVRIYGASSSSTGLVSFAALRDPLPVYFEVSGFAAVSFPGAYPIGGGSWQTNMVNLFIAFRSGTNTFVTPITAREP